MKHYILVCLLMLGSSFSMQALELSSTHPFMTTVIEKNQLYLNIPDHLLDTPMLFVRYETNSQREYMQVVWSLHNNQMVLKMPALQSTAGITLPIGENLQLKENILALFPLEKTNRQVNGHTINITDLLLTQNIEWRLGYSETSVPSIGMVMESKDLVDEVIVKVYRGMIKNNSKISVPFYYAFCMLPEPMPARPYDYRMGFFNERYNDFSNGPHNRIANIARWRLEKLHKHQEISLPKKPITFIMSPDIPIEWRPYVRAGIEEWLPAFEAAGFKNAIVVEENDSLSEWQAYSIHTSVVYWLTGYNFRGAERGGFGGTVGNVIDERTGEVLKADIFIGSAREAYSERYFVRAAPLDKRAQRFPFPDELLGELYQTLVAHETGHTFGLLDSHFGQYAYPVEKMKDVAWLETMGHTPSVMNYTRQNNVAQPEDSIPPSLLNQKVGPMDTYSIKWGYMEFLPEISDVEKGAVLESLIRQQDSIPWYRHSRSSDGIGPSKTYEIVDCRDVVQSTVLMLKNLERVMELIPEACYDQKDNARMERLYEGTLELWFYKMKQVVYLIGGYDIHMQPTNISGNRYEPIPLDSQMEALEYLMQQALYPPKWLTNPEFEPRMNHTVNRDIILEYQMSLMMELFNPYRMKRLEYMKGLDGFVGIYKRFLTSLQTGVFRELYDGSGTVPPRNQEIQLRYLDFWVRIVKKERINVSVEDKIADFTDYSKGLILEQLMDLKKDIKKELKRNKKKGSIGHWNSCLLLLQEIP